MNASLAYLWANSAIQYSSLQADVSTALEAFFAVTSVSLAIPLNVFQSALSFFQQITTGAESSGTTYTSEANTLSTWVNLLTQDGQHAELTIATALGAPTVTSVAFSGSAGDYTVTITGAGFGSGPAGVPGTETTSYFRIADGAQPGHGEYGFSGDQNTLDYQSWTDNQIVVSGLSADPGDAIELALWNTSTGVGATWGGYVPPTASDMPVISSVQFSGSGQNLSMTIYGSGFGNAPANLSSGDTQYFVFGDFRTPSNGGSSLFSAGNSSFTGSSKDGVTLNYVSWSNDEIVINGFGGTYGQSSYVVQNGDPVTIQVWNTSDTAATGPQTAWGGFITNTTNVAATDDFYGDSHSDILWRQTGGSAPGSVYVWQMNGRAIVGGGAAPWVDPSWTIQGTGDFTGNGASDILWGSNGGAVDLWSMNGTQVSSTSYLGWVDPSLGWTIQGTGDFFGNGNTDIVWANSSSGAVDLWVTNGTQVSSTAFVGSVGPNSGWTLQGVGDFTGDGKTDILWQNSTTGAVNLWVMDGSTIVSNDYISAVAPSSDWKMQFLGDFNGDGKTDILWQNSATGAVDLWIMNGSTITSNDFVGSVGANSDWTIQGVGDYAGNGNTDILWRNSTTGAVDMWTMNGPQLSSNAYVNTVDNSWQIQHV